MHFFFFCSPFSFVVALKKGGRLELDFGEALNKGVFRQKYIYALNFSLESPKKLHERSVPAGSRLFQLFRLKRPIFSRNLSKLPEIWTEIFLRGISFRILPNLARYGRNGTELTTPMYGPNQSLDRNAFWGELSFVEGRWNRPWVIGRILILFIFLQKRSCHITADERFSYSIRQYELLHLPLGGKRYTWSRCQEDLILRMDCFFISLSWAELFRDCI